MTISCLVHSILKSFDDEHIKINDYYDIDEIIMIINNVIL